MAGLARVAETVCHVIGIRRALVVCQVASITVGIDNLVIVVRVARGARNSYMTARKRKRRYDIMIDRRRAPRRGCVAGLATGAEAACNVVRIG